jgi:hypothetical protein
MRSNQHGRLVNQHHHHHIPALPRSSALRGTSAASLNRPAASSGHTITERSSSSGSGLFGSTGATALFMPRVIQPNCHAHCAARCLVTLFDDAIYRPDATPALLIYQEILKALRNESIHAATRCILLNCLLQLRANPADHRIYLIDHEAAGVDQPEPPFTTPLLPTEFTGPASRSSTLSNSGTGGINSGASGKRRLTLDTERGHQLRPTVVDHLLSSSTSSLGSNRRTSEPPPPSVILGNNHHSNNSHNQSKTIHTTVAGNLLIMLYYIVY